ncbi:tripartite tricarboxylate transporter substrate binding protein [Ramlibacter sp. PS3R-8]|uniref:Bug family tripartite tricarboxylate transporter substrate binding protein n=1 Tax=Ramlibacter sp. PS3R-8 TaxID=3133437 RepID=UPI0030B2A3C8
MTRRLAAIAMLAGAALATNAAAQDFPTKPIRLIVPGPPGGPTDMLARELANKLTEYLPQPTVVINQAGAGGMIGASTVAKADPDGYTLLFGNSGPLASNMSLYEKVPYDVQRDFIAIARFVELPNVLLVGNKVPANSVSELVALIQKGGNWSYGSGGNGSSHHISGAMFAKRAGVAITHVPYKGSTPAMQDVIGGQIPINFTGLVDALPQIKAGTVKALAVTTLQRAPAMPNLPTMSEAGLAGYNVGAWMGVVAPAGTPPKVVEALNAAIVRAGRSPEMVKKVTDLGGSIVVGTPAEFADFMKKDIAHWAALVKESGARLD